MAVGGLAEAVLAEAVLVEAVLAEVALAEAEPVEVDSSQKNCYLYTIAPPILFCSPALSPSHTMRNFYLKLS